MAEDHTCWNCHKDVHGNDHCPSCNKILPLIEDVDYFSYLGMKKRLNLDLDELEKKFYKMSKKYHPDYFSNGDEIEKEISIKRSSLLNSAYKILKDPIRRAKYLLQLEWGEIPKEEKRVPPEILMEVLDLQEKLQLEKDEKDNTKKSQLKNELELIKNGLRKKLDGLNSELTLLFNKWDSAITGKEDESQKQSILKEISKNLSIRAYLNTLISTYEN